MLVGVTGAALDTVCASGYAIGGGSSLTTSARYTCTAAGEAASAWVPAPDSTAHSCQGACCLGCRLCWSGLLCLIAAVPVCLRACVIGACPVQHARRIQS